MSANLTFEPFCLSNIEAHSLELNPSQIKILIVDDNPDNLRLLSRILTECGYAIQRAISGQLALNAVRVNPPHLILLDVLMPDLNGYEVCRQLKSEARTCGIPVIFLSALTEELNKVKAFELGGADYITKPFQSKEVLIRIKHQLTILGLQHQLQQKNQDLTDRNAALQAEIRERHQAEEALKQSEFQLTLKNQQLKKALKTIKITQSQLIQTEKMSSLGQMVAGIAHEINNPVNFIYGNLSHVESYVRDFLYIIQNYQNEYPQKTPKIQEISNEIDLEFIEDDLPKILDSMKEGSDRIRKIVLSLRNFSRLDESKMKAVDLSQGIESTLLILGHQLQEDRNRSKICLKKEYVDLPKVTCNASHINQVFMNLLSNAIDALADYRQLTSTADADRFPTIWIRTELTPANTVKIQIADNGSGMSEEVRPHIFDPFFTTKPVGSGSGLGLSISYSIIVEEHGGKIECHSVPDIGTKFTIELPLQE
jgi:two-component system, NtrC family, sensor kinase